MRSKQRTVQPTSCYFSDEEKRIIGEIADIEERPHCKIVQIAVRVLGQLYKTDPDKVRQLGQKAQRATL